MLIEFELIFNGPTLPGSVFIHQNKCNNSHNNTQTQEQEVWKGVGGGETGAKRSERTFLIKKKKRKQQNNKLY